MLPPDGHIHSEWSWDAVVGSMEQSCARAVELGLPSIAHNFANTAAMVEAQGFRSGRAPHDSWSRGVVR